MRKHLLAATAALAVTASPAVARDNSWYAGIEGGVLLVEDMALNFEDDFLDLDNAYTIDHNTGFDVDVIGGYDTGMLRFEAELAYKRAGIDKILFDQQTAPTFGLTEAEVDGNTSVISAMFNALLDFGDDAGFSGYLGAGVGPARVRVRMNANTVRPNFLRDSDDTIAVQGIAGVRAAITPTLDLGVKYRLFNAGNLSFGSDEGANPFNIDTRFRSHSLLASLIYNSAAPAPVVIAPPPPPPPPPPPATQTCPDGSVILATDVCPPPPPPPPPPAGERG
jgi:opacity protein-like surface antigen